MGETQCIELSDVGKCYQGDVWALRSVDVRVGGGVTALVGVNGAGKSTLLSTLAGSSPPTTGMVRVAGADVYGKGRKEVLPQIAVMPQSLVMPATLTAFEVVSLIGWMRGLRGREAKARAEAALATVDLLDRAGDRVKALSGGMRRRVALAQAIVAEPRVLLLDEPSTGLDPQQRRRMVEIVKTLPGTVVFSSHVMEDVIDTADRILVLHEGQIVFDGDVEALCEHAPPQTAASRRAETAFLALISTRVTVAR